MAMRNPATTKLRNAVVRAFNRGKTQAEVAAEIGLTRGVVGRLLAEARAMKIPVVRYSRQETAQRSAAAERANAGEAAYMARMSELARKGVAAKQAAGKAT